MLGCVMGDAQWILDLGCARRLVRVAGHSEEDCAQKKCLERRRALAGVRGASRVTRVLSRRVLCARRTRAEAPLHTAEGEAL